MFVSNNLQEKAINGIKEFQRVDILTKEKELGIMVNIQPGREGGRAQIEKNESGLLKCMWHKTSQFRGADATAMMVERLEGKQ